MKTLLLIALTLTLILFLSAPALACPVAAFSYAPAAAYVPVVPFVPLAAVYSDPAVFAPAYVPVALAYAPAERRLQPVPEQPARVKAYAPAVPAMAVPYAAAAPARVLTPARPFAPRATVIRQRTVILTR